MVGVAHPVENGVDEGGVASKGFADPDPDVRVPFSCALDLCRDVLGGVAPGSEEIRVYDDLGCALFHTGVDPFADVRFGDFQMRDLDDRFRCAPADLVSDVFELRVRLGAAAAVVDEQDRALHRALAARSALARGLRRDRRHARFQQRSLPSLR